MAGISAADGIINPPIDTARYLPRSISKGNFGYYEDPKEIELYQKMLHETDPQKQRAAMRLFENYVLDEQAHMIWAMWWHRIVPYRSYVKGWKISPSHYLNQDLATIWLDK